MSPVELRQHIETDLSDQALQQILDGETAEIVRRFGAPDTQADVVRGGTAEIVLTRPVQSIVSVTETLGGKDTVLDSDDYERRGQVLTRVYTGGRWRPHVTVVYVPEDTSAQRDMALVQLARLAIEHNGLAEEWSGDYRSKSVDYVRERERILRGLAPAGGMVIV